MISSEEAEERQMVFNIRQCETDVHRSEDWDLHGKEWTTLYDYCSAMCPTALWGMRISD